MAQQLDFLISNLPSLLIGFPGHRPGGLFLSILLSFTAIGIGFVFAVFVGAAHESRSRPFRIFAYLYVQIFRGIPLIVLLLIVHQALGIDRHFGLAFPPLLSALAALTLYSSAYQAEIIRAGFQAVPDQLTDSARLLGGNRRQVFRTIKLRYAFHVMLPAFTGQAISLFKDSSIVVILGVADLMTVARIALGSDVGQAPYWLGLYLIVGFLYFAVALTLSQLASYWEQSHHSTDLIYSWVNY